MRDCNKVATLQTKISAGLKTRKGRVPVLPNSPGYAGPSLAAGNFSHFVCSFGFSNKMAGVWKPALSTTGKLVSRFLYTVKSSNTLRRYSDFAVFCGFIRHTDGGQARLWRIFEKLREI
jgi:hypothetical protein